MAHRAQREDKKIDRVAHLVWWERLVAAINPRVEFSPQELRHYMNHCLFLIFGHSNFEFVSTCPGATLSNAQLWLSYILI
jgi:hypothetical protein